MKPLDKKQALCLRGGSIYYWGGHIQSAIDLLCDMIRHNEELTIEQMNEMLDLVSKAFPDVRTRFKEKR